MRPNIILAIGFATAMFGFVFGITIARSHDAVTNDDGCHFSQNRGYHCHSKAHKQDALNEEEILERAYARCNHDKIWMHGSHEYATCVTDAVKELRG